MFFKKPERKLLAALNLVPLIDISALIIIFLVLGAIFGESGIQVPQNMLIPQSSNKEALEVAPVVTIQDQQVKAEFLGSAVPLAEFLDGRSPSEQHLQAVKGFLASTPNASKKSGVLLNVVADRKTSYRTIYEVVRFYRQAGFQSVLFVAQGR